MDRYELGRVLKQARKARGETLRSVSEGTDVSFSMWGQIEKGKDTTTRTLREMGEHLGLDVGFLVTPQGLSEEQSALLATLSMAITDLDDRYARALRHQIEAYISDR